ncbi:MAG: hypothetical protein HC926_01155 [Synechococcaceae cyanobacterium SM2_3_60]|nr:hypothetical protein [Synechococcaceae cyanobacterium SM2_3_60]
MSQVSGSEASKVVGDLAERLTQVAAAVAEDTDALAAAQALPEQFQHLLASLSASQRQPVQPILTEMNRLMQLLQHHLMLWQRAKQKRPERVAQVQHDVQQLQQFCQHLSQNLE